MLSNFDSSMESTCNYIQYKVWYKITWPFPNFSGATFEHYITSSHTLLGMWLLTHVGI